MPWSKWRKKFFQALCIPSSTLTQEELEEVRFLYHLTYSPEHAAQTFLTMQERKQPSGNNIEP